jgi:hypothetical protein
MIQADTFVGSLAILLAIGIAVTAIYPTFPSERLAMVLAIRSRFGELAARSFVVLIALVLLCSGIMILRDLRPAFAAPLSGNAPRSEHSNGP